MPRTKADPQTIIVARARRSRAARRRLLEKAVKQLNDQPRIALQTMGYYVEATCGFKGLAQQTGIRRERLVRMLSSAGRPRLRNFGYTDLMVDGAPSPHQSDTTLRWLIDRLRS